MRDWITKTCPKCGEYMLFQPRLVIDTWDCHFCGHQILIKAEERQRLRKELDTLESQSIWRKSNEWASR